jgi:TRAP-type C4-dicarboxylate transport system substrate-binding protein
MPMGEVYSALAKGVIDGVVAPPDTLQALHLVEVADYYYELRVPRGAYPARAMGAERWADLAGWQRELLARSSAAWQAALTDEIYRSEAAGRAAGEGRIASVPPTSADQARFDAAYLKDAAANARHLDRFGIDGMRALRIARASIPARDRISCGGTS